MVAFTYGRWPFTRGSNCKTLTGKFWCFGLVVINGRWLLIQEVVVHGGLTVVYKNSGLVNFILDYCLHHTNEHVTTTVPLFSNPSENNSAVSPQPGFYTAPLVSLAARKSKQMKNF